MIVIALIFSFIDALAGISLLVLKPEHLEVETAGKF